MDWFGKIGGEGLSFGSDLDLLVVGEGESAVQKAVQFLTEERASGTLFKVDFRLRPYAEGRWPFRQSGMRSIMEKKRKVGRCSPFAGLDLWAGRRKWEGSFGLRWRKLG